MSFLFAILAIGLLIIIHELGHFGAARLLGMKVNSFSVGFGPVLLKFRGRNRETEYRLSLLPLGGYVQVAGMAPEDGTPEDEPRSYSKRPLWQRLLVIIAGPFTNWLFAFIALTFLFATGIDRPVGDTRIGLVVPESPAAVAGLQKGDRITAIDGAPLAQWSAMVEAIHGHKGAPMTVTVERQGLPVSMSLSAGANGQIGIGAATDFVRLPVGPAMGAAVVQTVEVAKGTFGALGQLIRGEGGVELRGPVGLVSETAAAARTGLRALLDTMIMVSLALALMNLLPIPGLDGGRLFFMAIELVRRKPVNPKAEAIVHTIGIGLVVLLILFTVFTDLKH